MAEADLVAERLHGFHPVHEALRARRRRCHRFLLREGTRHPEAAALEALAAEAGVPCQRLARPAFDALAGTEARAQGFLLEADPLPLAPLEAFCRPGEGPRWLVALDQVQDPQNVGAIARVAEAAGALGLVLPRHRTAPPTPAVSKASAGALEVLEVARVTNLARALETLQAAGYWTLAADPEAPDELFALPDRVLRGDLVLVLGGEGRGLRPGLGPRLDHRARIPMRGRVASLNVATAAAVFLFELVRRAPR